MSTHLNEHVLLMKLQHILSRYFTLAFGLMLQIKSGEKKTKISQFTNYHSKGQASTFPTLQTNSSMKMSQTTISHSSFEEPSQAKKLR